MNEIAPYSCLPKNAVNGYGMKYTPINFDGDLVANVEQHFTVPEYINGGAGLIWGRGPAYLAVFRVGYGTADVFLAVNETATIPSGAIAQSFSGMLDREEDSRYVFSGDVISLIATQNVKTSVLLYSLN